MTWGRSHVVTVVIRDDKCGYRIVIEPKSILCLVFSCVTNSYTTGLHTLFVYLKLTERYLTI